MMAGAVVRAAPIGALGVLAFIVVLTVSAAGVYAESRPATVLRWAPNNAIAQAVMASRLVAADHVAEGRRLAVLSTSRSPINVVAIRSIATAADADGDRAAAERFFTLANIMSRRDRPTQIWLIRRAFENGDYEGAVRSFDIAMRTSARAVGYLGPILVTATADRRTLPPLTRLLDGNPSWRVDVLRALVDSGPNSEHVALLVRGRLNASVPDERAALQLFLNRLVREERFDLAWSVYRDIAPAGAAATGGLRNGDFEQSAGFVPFDWSLADDGDLLGLRTSRPDGRPGSALSLIARNNRTGPLARQLIRLAPGLYRISFEAGSIPASPADRPRLAISCASGEQVLGEWRPANAGEEPQRVTADLHVPAGCGWQWLTVNLNSSEAGADVDPWIDNLSIRERPAPR